MDTHTEYSGGENINLRQILMRGKSLRLRARVDMFADFLRTLDRDGENLFLRRLASATAREVQVQNPGAGSARRMVMFGSNDYLGLANHPLVKERATRAIRRFGAGVAGPPLLNGYTSLHRSLEERLAALKGTEDALLFSSGYAANVGLVSALLQPGDMMVYDSNSHASFCDGITMSGTRSVRFRHNDCAQLARILEQNSGTPHDTYVGVEGVYSMDGDLAPLPEIVDLCDRYGAILILDDAHGTGVMGPGGRGTSEHFDLDERVPVTMGTFSKTLAVTGAFVAASRPVIGYLRYFARSYMFSASLPPPVLAAVHGGLDVIEREPGRLDMLRRNVAAVAAGLRHLGFDVKPQAAIVPLMVPSWMNIRQSAQEFHRMGIFVNSVEYPAVPVSRQRFRISVMATHTPADIAGLLTAVEEIWSNAARQADRPALSPLAA